jgi:hypothetical protein
MRDKKWDPPVVPEEPLSTNEVEGEPDTASDPDEMAGLDAPEPELEDDV